MEKRLAVWKRRKAEFQGWLSYDSYGMGICSLTVEDHVAPEPGRPWLQVYRRSTVLHHWRPPCLTAEEGGWEHSGHHKADECSDLKACSFTSDTIHLVTLQKRPGDQRGRARQRGQRGSHLRKTGPQPSSYYGV